MIKQKIKKIVIKIRYIIIIILPIKDLILYKNIQLGIKIQ